MSVLANYGSENIVTLHVEDEGHYNWLHTSTCSVWEFQASPRRGIPLAFGISFILPLGLFASELSLLKGVFFVHYFYLGIVVT